MKKRALYTTCTLLHTYYSTNEVSTAYRRNLHSYSSPRSTIFLFTVPHLSPSRLFIAPLFHVLHHHLRHHLPLSPALPKQSNLLAKPPAAWLPLQPAPAPAARFQSPFHPRQLCSGTRSTPAARAASLPSPALSAPRAFRGSVTSRTHRRCRPQPAPFQTCSSSANIPLASPTQVHFLLIVTGTSPLRRLHHVRAQRL